MIKKMVRVYFERTVFLNASGNDQVGLRSPFPVLHPHVAASFQSACSDKYANWMTWNA